MRTLIIVFAGFVLLAVCMLVARLASGSNSARITAAKVFIVLWLIAAGVNMWIGVSRGYSVVEELPIFLLIFTVPAAVAAWLWRRSERSRSKPQSLPS